MADGQIVADYDPQIAIAFSETEGEQPAPDLWPAFEALSAVPTLAIRGGLSDILSAATLEEMEARHPSLRTVVVDNRGHVPLLNEPECLAAMTDFFAGLRTA